MEETTPPGRESDSDAEVQGEGDYKAARRYRERTEHFLESADVEAVARRAVPKSKAEAEELQRAEEVGRSHSAGAAEQPADSEPAQERGHS
jgi:hypothetical protein